MARRRRRQTNVEIIPFIVLLLFGLIFTISQSQFKLAFIIGTILFVILLIGVVRLLIQKSRQEKLSRSGIAEIDRMSGLDFEKYLQALLLRRGYTQVRLTTTYDLGVDLVAQKDGYSWAIQAKRYSGTVGLDAIRQVIAAKNHYKCDKAMVITNSYFTKNAQTIASSTDCVLVDRTNLIDLILKTD